MNGSTSPRQNSFAALVTLVFAPLRLVLFFADCALRPRPWDAGSWHPRSQAH